MNFKLKALTVAAVAAMSLSSAANAITSGDIFLVAFDTVTKNSFSADTGILADSFTNTNQSYNFSADANWLNFASNSSAANTIYQVIGHNNVPIGPNGAIWTTSNDISTPGATSRFNTVAGSFSSSIGTFNLYLANNAGTTNYVSSSATFGKASEIGVDFATAFNNFTNTAALGANDNFYKITKTAGATASKPLVLTTYTQADGVTKSFWNLSTAGVLNYSVGSVAAVPEADTSAMMLAGLGLMGFVARRRRSV